MANAHELDLPGRSDGQDQVLGIEGQKLREFFRKGPGSLLRGIDEVIVPFPIFSDCMEQILRKICPEAY